MSETVHVDLLSTLVQAKLNQPILKVIDCSEDNIRQLLHKFQLTLNIIANNKPISGSFWGDSEAGVIGKTVFVREDTPVHSLLHETCHFICMDEIRRESMDTNAEGDCDEENAVCYLQIILANDIAEINSERMMQDMDSWGYTFRLGSAKAWFENDAEDALVWLQNKRLLDSKNQPNYTLRQK